MWEPGLGSVAVPPFGPYATVALALLAAPLETAGLAIARFCTDRSAEPPACLRALPKTAVAFLGGILLFAALGLGSLETLMGAGNNGEGLTEVALRKAVLLAQCTKVLLCFAAERFWVTGSELPHLQRRVCLIVWLGSTLLEWAAPWPHGDTSTVLHDQENAGCPSVLGSQRVLFSIVYVPLWLTAMTYTVLMLNCPGPRLMSWTRPREDSDTEEEYDQRQEQAQCEDAWHVVRRVLLPLLYGFAVSASGVIFAAGWGEGSRRFYCIAGALLLGLATWCAMEWILQLELTLGVWAPLSQCCATLLRLFQNHLIFREFRWPSKHAEGFLIGKELGVYFYLFGFTLLLAVLLIYVMAYGWEEWSRTVAFEYEDYPLSRQQANRAGSRPDLREASRAITRQFSLEYHHTVETGTISSVVLRLSLLPICLYCYFQGVTSPLYHYQICTPNMQWLNGEEAIQQFQNSTGSSSSQSCIENRMGFVEQITWLYDNHMPFSAMLMAYRSVVGPPLDFGCLIAYITQPVRPTIPEPVMEAVRDWLVRGAPFKFAANLMVPILYVTGIQSADPGGGSFRAWFTMGFAHMFLYCVTYGHLVRSLEPEPDAAAQPLQEREFSSTTALEREKGNSQEDSGDSDEEDSDDDKRESFIKNAILAVGAFIVVCFGMYFTIKKSFITLDFRYKGGTVLQIKPVLLDLWYTLMEVNMPLGLFAAATLVFFLLLRIVLWLILRTVHFSRRKSSFWNLGNLLRGAEGLAKQYTLCLVWAESIVLVWLAILTRSRHVDQVCAALPSPPIGLFATAALGMGMQGFSLAISNLSATPQPAGLQVQNLPGGRWVWQYGPIALFFFWACYTVRSSDPSSPKVWMREDVNEILMGFLPAANQRILQSIPESKGNCQALWQQYPDAHKDCVGRAPLVHLQNHGWDLTVMWATGLNKVVLTEMKVEHPSPLAESRTKERWDLTVSGVFTDLKVWVKAVSEEWSIDNNVCCDKNFTFTAQASANCTQGKGFDEIRLQMVHVDRIKVQTKTDVFGGYGSVSFDYGDAEEYGKFDLKKIIQDYMTGKVGGGRLLMKKTSGGNLDVLDFIRERLQEVVSLNTIPSRLCPAPVVRPPPPPPPGNGSDRGGGRAPPAGDGGEAAVAAVWGSDAETN